MEISLKRRFSDLTGKELLARLRAVEWYATDFARFIGVTSPTMITYTSGRMDGRIPLSVQRSLEYVESDPVNLLALPELQTPRNSRKAKREALAQRRINDAGMAAYG